MTYFDYEVPKDLVFRTVDIERMRGLKCSARLSAEDFENILSAPNKIISANVTLSFSISQKDILVQGTVEGKTRLECARCLEFFENDFSEDFFETYSIKSEIIDIMSLVVQTLALIEDIRFICKEDCKGLCDECGQNRNKVSCSCTKESYSPFAVLKDKKKI
ncbi:uncharacterized protein Dip510_001751 [Elusimicrobium posterum]|uniref:YceD family protein n=1 Tax=Elusimicrobium posterum TaxID=3116653 RepID=UPI003C70B9B3